MNSFGRKNGNNVLSGNVPAGMRDCGNPFDKEEMPASWSIWQKKNDGALDYSFDANTFIGFVPAKIRNDDIYAMFLEGIPRKMLADAFGISYARISQIITKCTKAEEAEEAEEGTESV